MAKKKKVDTLGEFPLPEGHYFHPQVVSRSAHYGESETERSAIRLLQQAVGAPASGIYDEPTREAVERWQGEHDLPVSPIVDASVWEELRNA